MECCAIWFRVEDHEIRGYKMTLNFGSAIVEKNTEKQLARTYRKRRSGGNDWRGKIPVTNNKKETKEIDRTHAKRSHWYRNGYRRKNGGKQSKETKADNARLDVGRQL